MDKVFAENSRGSDGPPTCQPVASRRGRLSDWQRAFWMWGRFPNLPSKTAGCKPAPHPEDARPAVCPPPPDQVRYTASAPLTREGAAVTADPPAELYQPVLDAPDDDAPRLACADWYEGHGQAQR